MQIIQEGWIVVCVPIVIAIVIGIVRLPLLSHFTIHHFLLSWSDFLPIAAVEITISGPVVVVIPAIVWFPV